MTRKALVIIDVQKAFDHASWGERNNLNAEKNIERILERWREIQYPVIHIQHVSNNPESLFYKEATLVDFKEVAKPQADEVIFQKKVNSAFIGTELEAYLRKEDILELGIVGLTTPHCVSTTTRMSSNLGFQTTLISDATSSFEITDHHGKVIDPETIQHVTLATLHNEFAEVISTEQLLARVEGGESPE